ncbi:hypothetical protein BA173_05240 [Rickettsia sp. MEAM1 (Bemisia tabaci)]|uniref:hypothetical protein n=1 Tax=unclassified Rickettsia TaxID=114295 RepID=UPI00031674CA|nr:MULTISPECIES: hypothetical protein [unclassified Rickettsia]ASX28208.1 hypothetical protein BA173_05240 [Rickettsia sp. MEAM1 (Bemisia tabaci)]ODA37907.1 hypothetical protein A8V33_01205 [Rickettsia sp. wb]ODA38321.1 hypothetical protein A8V34_01575 [Rickettsia sp. wq]
MSNQNKKTINNITLDLVEKEINTLKDEVAYLLENPATEEDIERIEQRLEELEKMLYNVV